MPSDLNYAHEKYGTAVRILALGDAPLRDRLLDAYRSSASSAHPPRGGLGPEIDAEVQTRIEDFDARMTAAGDGPDGSIAATVAQMSDEEVREVAAELVSISRELDFAWHDRRNN